MITKTDILAAEFYNRYIVLVKEEEIGKALRKNTEQLRKFLKKIPKKKLDYAYAEGKWTIKELVQHMIDAERVFAYRALSFSRKDAISLPGFDENSWAANSRGAARKWEDLLEEFKSLRKATEYLFDTFTEDQLKFAGQANGVPLNALALGFIISGHAAHHMGIMKERYL
jgi:uncharacterized damage-inducible protein DinB